MCWCIQLLVNVAWSISTLTKELKSKRYEDGQQHHTFSIFADIFYICIFNMYSIMYRTISLQAREQKWKKHRNKKEKKQTETRCVCYHDTCSRLFSFLINICIYIHHEFGVKIVGLLNDQRLSSTLQLVRIQTDNSADVFIPAVCCAKLGRCCFLCFALVFDEGVLSMTCETSARNCCVEACTISLQFFFFFLACENKRLLGRLEWGQSTTNKMCAVCVCM